MKRTTELIAEPGERVEVLCGDKWLSAEVETVECVWRKDGSAVWYHVLLPGYEMPVPFLECDVRKPQQP